MALVEAAVLAPSADNRHLFHLEHCGSRVRLWGDQAFMDAPQHVRILCLISFGAATENMKLRAQRLGLKAQERWFPDDAEPRLVAELDLARATQGAVDPLEAAIPQRHTNRRVRFRGPALSPAEMGILSAEVAEVAGVAGVEIDWFDSPEPRRQILRLIRIAETERLRSRALHQELFSAIRFDVGWKSSASEGLAPGSLEVEAPMRPIFSALRHWEVLRLLNLVGVHKIFGVRGAYLPCRLAPHVGALTTSLDVQAGAPAIGAAFERVWLRATLQGLSLQPFAGSALLAFPGYPGVATRVQETLSEGWKHLAPGRTPLMVFRVGRASPPSVRAGRRALNDYVLPRRKPYSTGVDPVEE